MDRRAFRGRIFDADNHLYETEDAFTRHLPAQYEGVFKYVQVHGRTKIAVNNVISEYIPNPTFEVVGRPGALAANALAGDEVHSLKEGELEHGPQSGTETQVEDWEVHFVAPGRKGPFFARAEAWSGPGGRVLTRFTLCDEGMEDAIVASGTAAFRVSEKPLAEGDGTIHSERVGAS
jgi:hypothetical protein